MEQSFEPEKTDLSSGDTQRQVTDSWWPLRTLTASGEGWVYWWETKNIAQEDTLLSFTSIALLTHKWELRQAKPQSLTFITNHLKNTNRKKCSWDYMPQKLEELTAINKKLTAQQWPHKNEKSKLMAVWYIKVSTRRMIGQEVRQWEWQQENWKNMKNQVTKSSTTLLSRLPHVCEKNFFHFFSFIS